MDLAIKLIVLLPLLAAAIAGLFCRVIGDRPAQIVTCAALLIAAALSVFVFVKIGFGPENAKLFVVKLFTWIDSGTLDIVWSLRVDTLTAVMLIVVTGVSSMVHVYSIGYMAEDPGIPRFMSYLSLFTFFMLMLVTSDNLVQLFFGWEGVGLASYLLIGFWYDKPSANAAAIKAFIVNRVGDFGFALGIFAVWMLSGSVNYNEIFAKAPDMAAAHFMFLGKSVPALETACLLLFVGAMGKSAQLGLHTWLPDAMEGPTPVSALIHAATMVTAGVYMVCLLSPMFEYAPFAKHVVLVIGAITALFAATVGLVQNDIKRVIAYSTCSQLGYMFMAAGVGAYQASMFHLFTHAFFKALLFLGAGAVIHAMAHEQDMRRYGGLAKYLPVTFGVMTIGTIAITGLGIPGIELGFAGFYSKDSIIHAAYAAGEAGDPMGYFGFVMGVFVAGLTAFYSWRLAFFTFNGHARWTPEDLEHHWHNRDHAHDDHASPAQIETHSEPEPAHGHDHHAGPALPHEAGWSMRLPLILLSIGAIASGFLFHEKFIGAEQIEFWKGAIFTAVNNHVLAEHEVPLLIGQAPLIVSVIGLLAAYYVYIMREGLGARLAAQRGPLYLFFYNKWFFDELYQATFVRAAKFLGDLFWKGGDQKLIDGLGPDGVSAVSYAVGKGAGRLQTGFLYHYAFVMLLGVAAILSYALWAWNA
jgi:NADH-quinone oxidoreductase subunit L